MGAVHLNLPKTHDPFIDMVRGTRKGGPQSTETEKSAVRPLLPPPAG